MNKTLHIINLAQYFFLGMLIAFDIDKNWLLGSISGGASIALGVFNLCLLHNNTKPSD